MSEGEPLQPNITAGRAQDWITSVLNPIIDQLRREVDARDRPWRWIPGAERLERFHPIPEQVSELYADNYDDFIDKHPDWRDSFARHDAALADVAIATRAACEKILGAPDVSAALGEALAGRMGAERDAQWFAAYVAAGYARLSRDHGLASFFDDHQELVGRARAASEAERNEVERAKEILVAIADGMLPELKQVRTSIADRYGARIRPTGT